MYFVYKKIRVDIIRGSLLILFVFVYFTTYQANSKTSLFTNGKTFVGLGLIEKNNPKVMGRPRMVVPSCI